LQPLTPESRRLFTAEVEARMLATSELYGGKLVAALDRQHPRDLFDVHCLFESGGLTDEMVECFVAYLAGHNRPVHEVLFARDQELVTAFENEFHGMARIPVQLTALAEARHRTRQELHSRLTDSHRHFLLGLVRGNLPGKRCVADICPSCPPFAGSCKTSRSSNARLRKNSSGRPAS